MKNRRVSIKSKIHTLLTEYTHVGRLAKPWQSGQVFFPDDLDMM
jgi:hypothetical protein